MLLELVCTPVFWFIDFFIKLVPDGFLLPPWGVEFVNIISKGLAFFPSDVWTIAIGNIILWSGVYLVDSIAVFILRKIPFLGIEQGRII